MSWVRSYQSQMDRHCFRRIFIKLLILINVVLTCTVKSHKYMFAKHICSKKGDFSRVVTEPIHFIR